MESSAQDYYRYHLKYHGLMRLDIMLQYLKWHSQHNNQINIISGICITDGLEFYLITYDHGVNGYKCGSIPQTHPINEL